MRLIRLSSPLSLTLGTKVVLMAEQGVADRGKLVAVGGAGICSSCLLFSRSFGEQLLYQLCLDGQYKDTRAVRQI